MTDVTEGGATCDVTCRVQVACRVIDAPHVSCPLCQPWLRPIPIEFVLLGEVSLAVVSNGRSRENTLERAMNAARLAGKMEDVGDEEWGGSNVISASQHCSARE